MVSGAFLNSAGLVINDNKVSGWQYLDIHNGLDAVEDVVFVNLVVDRAVGNVLDVGLEHFMSDWGLSGLRDMSRL